VPAAAVIPALIAYIKVVAVKKLVVEFQVWHCLALWVLTLFKLSFYYPMVAFAAVEGVDFYFEKIRVFKAGFRLEYISME
jgi:hypothetical protein